jgi:hypothetical protein
LQSGLAFDRTGHHEVPGSGGVVGPPDSREIMGLQPVVAWVSICARFEESDLVQIDVPGSEAGSQAPQVQLEADRGLADSGQAAQQQDLPAGTARLTAGRAVQAGRCRIGRPAGKVAEARPSAAAVVDVLRRAGRQRNIDAWARRLRVIFAGEYLHQLPALEKAMGRQTAALVMQLDAACRAADDLAEAAAAAFGEHPDAEILTSFPGIGPVTGARVLGEIGDDRARFRDARGLKSYAGSAPITVASGKSLIVRNRKVKNQRLAAAGYVWIFGALPTPVIKQHYDRRRAAGDRHAAAMRNLFNRLLGCLHHCLQTGQTFDMDKAFPLPQPRLEPAAA